MDKDRGHEIDKRSEKSTGLCELNNILFHRQKGSTDNLSEKASISIKILKNTHIKRHRFYR